MTGRHLRGWALAGSAIALVALTLLGGLAAPAGAQGLAFPGGPASVARAPADRLAAQATPATATPAAATATTAAASATVAATSTVAATATGAAASPTVAATATGAATSPTAAITATADAQASATATTAAAASPTATAATAATGTATSAATATATTAAAATAATTVTQVATPTPPPTATVPVATSTAVMIVTPIPAAAAAAAATTANVQQYMTGVPSALQYYNGPNAQYPLDWYMARNLGNPSQFTMYRTEPLGLCNTYYYQFQGVYYCYTGGAAAAMPDVLAPGMGVVPPSVFGPQFMPPNMSVGVVPGMMGGVVQTPTGYAVQSAWANVAPQYQYYYGPNYQYENDWYAQRHLNYPWLYQTYGYDPGSACGTYSYRYQDRFYCYTGASIGSVPPALLAPPPPGVAVDPTAVYAMQAYWGQVDPNAWYYYGADYQYDDYWYQQRHLANPLLYSTYGYEPVNECGSYYYSYQGQYYCYSGMYTYSGDVDWNVPVRYWSQVDPSYRYYYGPDYPYDDAWYAQRNVGYPDLYQPYDYYPGNDCGTYFYTYQGLYYCYLGN